MFEGYLFAEVIDVYDGDTITVNIQLFDYPQECLKTTNLYNSLFYPFKVRIHGLDTYEIRPKKSLFKCEKDRLKHKRKGIKAKKALRKLILEKEVKLVFCGKEKYGRILAEVYYNDINIKDYMIEGGHGWRKKNSSLKYFFTIFF